MSAYIPGQGYIPGRGLLGLISEYVTEAPSPAPAPQPSAPPPEEVIIAEPSNSRNLLLENERLKGEINSLKHEVKIIKSMCGLDRRLKITKIEEEDLHKYCQYDCMKRHLVFRSESLPNMQSLILINKCQYELEPTMKNSQARGHKYSPYRDVIPINMSLSFTNTTRQGVPNGYPNYFIKFGFELKGGGNPIIDCNLIQNLRGLPEFNSCHHNIDEYFVMNITFPKLPDFMKIDNVNTIDIDIYKMKGIYVITYE